MLREIHPCMLAAFLAVPLGGLAIADTTPPSLAIMSFTNQTLDDPEWQWLGSGIADMLATDLARAARFRIVDRDAVRTYLEELGLSETGLVDQQAALELGRVAKVEKALFGSYAVADDRIVIQAFVVDVESNDVDRVETVAGAVADFFDLEKALAFMIVENLEVPLTREEIAGIRYRPTDSLDAAARFYRGLDAYDRGQYFEALKHFRLAEKADREYDKPLLYQGHVLENLGEYEHAVLAFETLASRVPHSEHVPEGLFVAAKLSADELDRFDDALRLADRIIGSYADGQLRDGTVIATEHGPTPAIVYRRGDLAALMRLFKASVYVRLEEYLHAMRELEAADDGRATRTHYLRDLVKYAYVQTGEVLIPNAAPSVIQLDAGNPSYEEDYASSKRFEDAFTLESVKTVWNGETLTPYGFDEREQRRYISNKYSKTSKQWMTTADTYLFAAPGGYIVDSVDVWLEAFQTEPWTVDALVVAVGDYNAKGATGGPHRGYVSGHYRAPVLTGTRLFRLLIQVTGDSTKPVDQFAYVSGWRIKANLRKVAATASLTVDASKNVLLFVDPLPGQVADASSIVWRDNPSIDCPCRIHNLPIGPHRLVAFAAGGDRSIRRDGRRRELLIHIEPDRLNEIFIDFPRVETANEAREVLPGWSDFRQVLASFQRVGAGGKLQHLAGMQNQDGTYQVLFTKDFDIWRVTSPDGTGWSDAAPLPGPINTQAREDDFSIIQGEDGAFYLAFLSARGSGIGLYVSRSSDMLRWRKPFKVADLDGSYGRPSLMQLTDGSFRVYYPPAFHRVAYAESADFVNWTNGDEIEVDFQDFGQVTVDESGVFWLLYGGYEGRDHLFFVASSQDGARWRDFRRIDGTHTGHDLGSFHPVIVPTPGAGIALAWERTARLAFSRTEDGATWSPTSAELASGGKLEYPDAPFAFFRRLDRSYMLVYPNAQDELWSATSADPFL